MSDILDIAFVAVYIFLFYLFFGLNLQRRIIFREIDTTIEALAKPLYIWLLPQQRQALLASLPIVSSTAAQPPSTQPVVTQGTILAIALFFAAFVSVAVMSRFNQRGLPKVIFLHTCATLLSVAIVEAAFFVFIVQPFRPVRIDQLYPVLMTRLLKRSDNLMDFVGGAPLPNVPGGGAIPLPSVPPSWPSPPSIPAFP